MATCTARINGHGVATTSTATTNAVSTIGEAPAPPIVDTQTDSSSNAISACAAYIIDGPPPM